MSWPGTYCIYLPLVHLDTIFSDVLTEKLVGGLVEGAFLSFEEELEFSQALKDLRNVLVIFGHGPREHQDVIYVHQ